MNDDSAPLSSDKIWAKILDLGYGVLMDTVKIGLYGLHIIM